MDIYSNVDQEAMVALVAKMGKLILVLFGNDIYVLNLAADRTTTGSIQEAREGLSNVACDVIKATMSNNSANRGSSLLVPNALRLLPLYMLSMIKTVGKRN